MAPQALLGLDVVRSYLWNPELDAGSHATDVEFPGMGMEREGYSTE